VKALRFQLPIGLVCALLGVLLVTQFRTQRLTFSDIPSSAGDQATYISQLSDNNELLRKQVSDLNAELARYRADASSGGSNLDTLVADLQSLRMANGEVEVVGPGVSVLVDGDLTVFDLQDLVNELRDASAEAIAVNGVRVVGRSVIGEREEDGRLVVDRQVLTRPYRLQAIGDPDTLAPALQRKGGLIALMEARDPPLQVRVYRHAVGDEANRLKLPRTALDFTMKHGATIEP
jgi:uncharacterized protein YlxW (UPF0749 family)